MLFAREFIIGYICAHRNWFKINKQYQREKDVWTSEDKKHLIDTIMRDLDIPKIYLRQVDEKKFEIVDGQQRIETIWLFRDNKFSLEGKISGEDLDGKRYRELSADLTEQFDNFQLSCIVLTGYDDEKTRLLFSKLQRGKPLNPPEKLNAFPGSIVPLMRSIGKHRFFNKVIFSLKRYKAYHFAARFLLLENEGLSDISPSYLYDFFEKNKKLSSGSNPAKKVRKVLNFLDKAFPDKTPELNNDAWIINCYLLTSHLMEKYVLDDSENDFYSFYVGFWNKVEKARVKGKGETRIMRFIDANASGTTSKSNIQVRLDTMKQKFIEKHTDLEFLDSKRFFDHFEKTAIYRRDRGICQNCNKKVKWKDFEADHIKAYVKGGKTKIKNGQVLCSRCNEMKGAK